MRKLILVFLFLRTSTIFSEELGNGFLGINIGFEWYRYDSQNMTNDFFKIPVSFSAASSHYEIITSLSIVPEILHLDQYYTGIAKLPAGALQPFSFANFEIQYLLAEWKIFHFNGGFKVGHYGYLSSDWTTPVYTLFIAPKGSVYIFLGDHFMIQIPIEIPLGIYNHNINTFFTLFTGIEVTLDPLGPISNPVSNSAFFTLGFEYSYLTLETGESIKRQIHYYKPYFRFTLLY